MNSDLNLYVDFIVKILKQFSFVRERVTKEIVKIPHSAHPLLAHSTYLSILVKFLESDEQLEEPILAILLDWIAQIDAEIPKKVKFSKQESKLSLYLSIMMPFLA